MRLLNTESRELEEFGDDKIPLYAILSHTWGDHEITFHDVERRNADTKAGYEKIRQTCSIVAAHGFKYVWIDTCCIDKTSSAELSEAINSMYRWYQESGVCYAYLADVPSSAVDRQTGTIGPELSGSKWFTRGWTLQELIAPSMVIFLDQEWQEIGTKSSLQSTISKITGIPNNILQGAGLESASVAQRMSWASKRKTTRVEDLAYCLLGIFGVSMPMLYGEGTRAFIRLQEEIMKISDDYSLFAWESSDSSGGLLAPSPAAFVESSKIISLDSSSTLSGAITVNNKGIHVKLRFIDADREPFQRVELAILPCAVEGQPRKDVGIFLGALSMTKEYFERVESGRLVLIDQSSFSKSKYSEKNICVRREYRSQQAKSPLPKASADRNWTVVKLLLEKGVDLESQDKIGRTPLFWAIEEGNEEMVKILLEKGANLHSKDKIYDTPLSLAVEKGNEKVVKLLLEKGANPNFVYGYGQTPLAMAVENGNWEMVELLLGKGADIESEGKIGSAPLFHAILARDEEMAKMLLEEDADLDSKNQFGQTPLSLAAETENEAVVKLLLEKGANLESRDEGGWTPLLLAVKMGNEAVLKLLLNRGADIEAKGKNGQTPLFWAAREGNGALLKLMLKMG